MDRFGELRLPRDSDFLHKVGLSSWLEVGDGPMDGPCYRTKIGAWMMIGAWTFTGPRASIDAGYYQHAND